MRRLCSSTGQRHGPAESRDLSRGPWLSPAAAAADDDAAVTTEMTDADHTSQLKSMLKPIAIFTYSQCSVTFRQVFLELSTLAE